MRVTSIPHPVNAEVHPFVGESDHHIAWTADQDGHVALASAGVRSVAGVTLHTARLEQSVLRKLCDAVTSLPAAGPALPEIAQDGIEVFVTTSEALDSWRDPDTTRGSRLFQIAKAEKAILHVLTPYVPPLKCLEPWNGCVTIFLKAGGEVFAVHPENQAR